MRYLDEIAQAPACLVMRCLSGMTPTIEGIDASPAEVKAAVAEMLDGKPAPAEAYFCLDPFGSLLDPTR